MRWLLMCVCVCMCAEILIGFLALSFGSVLPHQPTVILLGSHASRDKLITNRLIMKSGPGKLAGISGLSVSHLSA